jgi:bifunctional non-homologous end joining protein LigD
MPSRTAEIRRYGERDVRLTNLGKVLFPDDGITKADVIDHVVRCQEPLLRALRRRPLSMERRVDGLRGDGFFHKRVPSHFPEWVTTTETPTSKGPMRQVVVDDLATLVLVTNFGGLTLHVPTCTIDRPSHPDHLVIDLDPPPDIGVERLREAARIVRVALEAAKLPAYARWTGSRGVHVVVPLDGTASQDMVVRWSIHFADRLVEQHASHFTVAFAKADRGDLIYVDVGRNFPGATCVVPFTIRPYRGAPLVMPVTWDELEHTGPRSFTLREGASRLTADPWPGFEESRASLTVA